MIVSYFPAADPSAERQEHPTSRVLAVRTGSPNPLLLYPVSEIVIDDAFRNFLLEYVAETARNKDMSYEPVAVHSVRLYGHAHSASSVRNLSVFDDTVRLLLDDRVYRTYGSGLPLIIETPFGVAFRTHPRGQTNPTVEMEMIGGVTHVDKVLSVFGELGFPLETVVVANTDREFTLADVLEDSMLRFSIERELEWSVIAYCDYLDRQNSWTNARGDTISIDAIATELLDRDEVRSACLGTHRVYALAKVCMRQRRDTDFVSPRTARRLETYLVNLSDRLTQLQGADGAWDSSWLMRKDQQDESSNANDSRARRKEQILVTGHMLEWMAIVETDLRPDATVLLPAARFLEAELRAHGPTMLNEQFFPTSHAVRALLNISCQPSDLPEVETEQVLENL